MFLRVVTQLVAKDHNVPMFRNLAFKLSNCKGSNFKFAKNGKQTQFNKRLSSSQARKDDNMKIAYYIGSGVVFIFGVSYASVPLYKVFCQMTGFGGTTQVADELKSQRWE
jgi:cytochrome c oxidase assembly protein Cox11